jgi:hypothetical protein
MSPSPWQKVGHNRPVHVARGTAGLVQHAFESTWLRDEHMYPNGPDVTCLHIHQL